MAVIFKDNSLAIVDMEFEPPERDIEIVQSPFRLEIISGEHAEPGAAEGGRVPRQLISRYVKSAVRRAQAEQMDNGRWYAEITLLPGVWAEGRTEDEAVAELESVTESWVLLKIEDHDRDLPVLETLDLNQL